MSSAWKSRRKPRPPSSAETELLLPASSQFYSGSDEMLRKFNALNTSRLRLSTIERLFKRFRSGSVDSDKAALSNLDDECGRSKAFTSNDSISKKDYPAASPRHYPGDAVWVTSASHPSPFSSFATDAQGQPLTGSRTQGHTTGFLSDLALQNTALTSATQIGTGDASTAKGSLPGAMALTAQELHDSVLSALGKEPSSSPVKSPGEKKPFKKQPRGTFEYVVQEGDTLVKIGAHFDVTPSELMKINKMVSRTVFVGQTLFIPDPNYVAGDPPTPRSASPIADSRPKMDIPLASLPSVPGHAVPVTSPTSPTKSSNGQLASSGQHWWSRSQKSQEEEEAVVDESDKECLQKFLKMPVRRVLEKEEVEATAGSEGFTVKGTLLVTPNAIMFDPSVSDRIVIDRDDLLKFSVVVYMEEVKGVALFHDISPRMFWKQPKELRTDSPKPEMFRSGQGKRPKAEGHDGATEVLEAAGADARLTPDGVSVGGDSGQRRVSPDGRDAASECKGETLTGRMSAELEQMTQITVPVADLIIHPGRASEEVEHALTSLGYTPASPATKHMSHSSELEVSEMSQFQNTRDVFGETRDFGPHMGRSSSEVHRQTSSALGRISDASPGDTSGHWFYPERSDSTSDSVSTPTQGFAPVHFTDRSPMTVTTHPKPVSGQRLVLQSQSPVSQKDLKSQENRIAEDIEVGATDSSGQSDVSMVPSDQRLQSDPDSLSDLSSIKNHPDQANKPSDVTSPDFPSAASFQSGDNALAFSLAAGRGDSQTVSDKTSDTHTVSDRLDSQVANLNLAAAGDDGHDSDDDSSKPKENSPRLPFSPLRAPVQHISSFFNYTSSFFRNSTAAASDKEDSSADGKGKYSSVATSVPYRIQLKSEFTKADISRALGPDPKEFLPRSDSHHFEETPLYLQIRRGIQKDKEIHQPRAFDHRNVGPLLEEYWFVVPRDMGDKLYHFLMEWQPDAYGDEVDTRTRERFFFDISRVEDITPLVSSSHSAPTARAAGDGPPSGILTSDEHFNETEKTWEILSKEEVYRAEKEQTVHREDVIDESSFPELIGSTVIIKEEHIRALMRSLPRNMSVGYNWELVYATHKHGYSLHNLYMRTEEVDSDAPVLLFITDTYGCVFGAYLSNTIRPNDTFYGSGATFLFTFYPNFKKFPWQGCNQFFMHGTKDFFAVGAGEGHFGLWLDGDLNKGRSHTCTTFSNDVLAKEEDFSILQLEVWRFVDSSLL